jgi:hypothetical protein
MNEKPKKRPWFQYHLSTAVIVMLAAGVLMGLCLKTYHKVLISRNRSTTGPTPQAHYFDVEVDVGYGFPSMTWYYERRNAGSLLWRSGTLKRAGTFFESIIIGPVEDPSDLTKDEEEALKDFPLTDEEKMAWDAPINYSGKIIWKNLILIIICDLLLLAILAFFLEWFIRRQDRRRQLKREASKP